MPADSPILVLIDPILGGSQDLFNFGVKGIAASELSSGLTDVRVELGADWYPFQKPTSLFRIALHAAPAIQLIKTKNLAFFELVWHSGARIELNMPRGGPFVLLSLQPSLYSWGADPFINSNFGRMEMGYTWKM